MSLIIIAVAIWCISALISHARQERLAREQQRQREAQARLLREQRAQAQRQREMEKEQRQMERQAEIERRERIAADAKLAKEQAAQAARIAKIEEEQRRQQSVLNKAVKDIDHLLYEMDQKRKYGEYLELERDACVPYGAEWHKWNNKVSANNNQLYAMETKLDSAIEKRDEAQRKLAS